MNRPFILRNSEYSEYSYYIIVYLNNIYFIIGIHNQKKLICCFTTIYLVLLKYYLWIYL
ncbi:hypothetical protein GLOIN_2v1576411 [Rhizophagus irregularis DAOM 181602=DAOM 197198]|uniref:Uncharacterized protein n=1 Tax=Rhizophagus irregularis (strain DAOM 181602 / DAOM 197198 / MUCL 43194) TaxID=747089 RepID=A0A2P4Q9T4_RHIID|nr:hypothetical protein GLOIN_2v1576411 [Rhizophagus irregularis DAOM 181602=DAOM 197198]POG74358.1 hypothetical protein GLOIN_2v1576411 [Rhizophagus irregularis DAOM 181602=DAOM 197198]|eukprot:XP_025181224.1 hypothetical protein GLOIN_2v1576411 [Rhizophagus irregularis DAOM 181602=DAOM 197198]